LFFISYNSYFSNIYHHPVILNFTYGDESEVKNYTNGLIQQLDSVEFESNSTGAKSIKIITNKLVGRLIIGAYSANIRVYELVHLKFLLKIFNFLIFKTN